MGWFVDRDGTFEFLGAVGVAVDPMRGGDDLHAALGERCVRGVDVGHLEVEDRLWL